MWKHSSTIVYQSLAFIMWSYFTVRNLNDFILIWCCVKNIYEPSLGNIPTSLLKLVSTFNCMFTKTKCNQQAELLLAT